MKRIEELYQEILEDEGLKAEFVQAAKDNQVEAFLQKNDCNVTPAELQEFAEKKQSEEGPLSDAELDVAAGGSNAYGALESVARYGIRCIDGKKSAADFGVNTGRPTDVFLCYYQGFPTWN